MTYYYPRMAARAAIPVRGELITLPLHLLDAELVLNDHWTPDEVTLTCSWQHVGIDPRLLRNAEIRFWLDDAPDGLVESLVGGRTGAGNLRFIGTVDTIERESGEGQANTVTVKAADYTDFFLRAKPFGASGIPDYSQTLDDAFRRIVSQTPGAEKLADRLEARGFTSWPRISDAVPKRFAGKGTVHVERNTDAWAVWQHVVGMLGLITFVEHDRVIVTTEKGYYRDIDPPVLSWGLNLSSLRETRDASGFGTGVGISSFDPTSGKTIEGVWPPRSAEAGKRRAVAVAQNTANPDEAIVQKYDWFTLSEILNEAAATQMAKRVYAERSKQELQGTATTSEMVVQTRDSKEPFSLLDLRVGDRIVVQALEPSTDVLLKTPRSERVEYLVRQGYDERAAEIIAATVDDIEISANVFYTKSVRTRVDAQSNEYECQVEFCNKVLVGDEEAA